MPRDSDESCVRAKALQELSGRWKLPLLDILTAEPLHFAALERALVPISRRMLTRSLRELESAGLVVRTEPRAPLGVVLYSATSLGRGVVEIVDQLADRASRGGVGAGAPSSG